MPDITRESIEAMLTELWEKKTRDVIGTVDIKAGERADGSGFFEAYTINKVMVTGRCGFLLFKRSAQGTPLHYTLNGTEMTEADVFKALEIDIENECK